MWQMLSTDTCKASVGINLNVGWENQWDPAHTQQGLPGVPLCSPWTQSQAMWTLHSSSGSPGIYFHLPPCHRSSGAASTPSHPREHSRADRASAPHSLHRKAALGSAPQQNPTQTTHQLTGDYSILAYSSMELLPSHSRYKNPLTAERRTRARCQGWVFIMGAASQP